MEADSELAEAEGFDFFFAELHGFDVFDGDGGAIGDSGTETGGSGAVPGGQAGETGEFADLDRKSVV